MESETLQNAVLGDSDALAVLIDKYKDIAFNLAFGIVKNREDALDITQEGFLKVLENIHNFRSEAKFSTWLYRIIYNLSIATIRSMRRLDVKDISDIIQHSNAPDKEPDYYKYEELHKAIDKLDENERCMIHLFYLAEKSVKEIHQVTGLTVSHIKVILYRARKKLSINLKYETTG